MVTLMIPIGLVFCFFPMSNGVQESAARELVDQLESKLHSDFQKHSKVEIVEKGLDKHVRGRLRTREEKVDEKTTKLVAEKLEKFFERKISALHKIVEKAERSTREFDVDAPLVEDEADCVAHQQQMNRTDLRNPLPEGSPMSGIHIAIDSFRCNKDVIRDFRWSGVESVERQFQENAQKDSDLLRQYIGTYSGLSRIYPAFRWESEPVTVDLFDPRLRPWFVGAETGPKDVVFLLDHSGSVKGQTLHLIRVQLERILITLTPNDFFTAVWYNNRRELLLTGCVTDGFMLQATTRNKRAFQEYLNNLDAQDQANLPPALNLSLSLFLSSEYSTARRLNQTSGGHKLIMLFTDGVEFWPTQVVREFKDANPATTIRLFSYAMGYGSGEIAAIRWSACELDGEYFEAQSIADVRRVSRAHLPRLSESFAKSIKNRKPPDRPSFFSFLYADSGGRGVVISISAPVINRMPEPTETNSTSPPTRPFAGVAGVDVSLERIRGLLPHNEQIHSFLIDNNGIVFYHPELKLPPREVNMVRRTACHDVRVKHRSGKRVQFGPADEQIRARMGLIDSVPTLDLVEVESEVTPKFTAFRDSAVRGDCVRPVIDGNREYRCAPISGTPLTVGFVVNRKSRALELDGQIGTLKYKENGMVGEWLNSPALCSEFLSSDDELDRFESLIDLADKKAGCLPEQAATMLPSFAQAVQEWRESWLAIEENGTCELSPRPPDFDRAHRSSFVEYVPGVVSFYPSCQFGHVRLFFNGQPQLSETRTDEKAPNVELQVNPSKNHLMTVYRRLIDENTGRSISRVGVQWDADYANSLWNSIGETEREKICGSSLVDCYLLSADLFVVASSDGKPAAHLSEREPQLFDKLLNMSVIKRRFTTIDYQATCPLSIRYAQAPSAPISHSPRPMSISISLWKFLQTAFSWLTLDFLGHYLMAVESKVFYNAEGVCHFKLSPTNERCVLAHDSYRIAVTKPTTTRSSVQSNCLRSVTVIPGTARLLSLVILEGECKKSRGKSTRDSTMKMSNREVNFKPTRVADCNLIKRRPRIVNPLDYSVDELKTEPTECSSVANKRVFQLSAFTLLVVLICLS